MKDNASPMRVSPNNNQNIYFINISTGDFSPVTLCNFDRLFNGLRTRIFSGMLFTCSRTQFRGIKPHWFFPTSRKKKKVYVSSSWVHFYLGDFLDKDSYTNRILIWRLL